jgi:hypothetical protein
MRVLLADRFLKRFAGLQRGGRKPSAEKTPSPALNPGTLPVETTSAPGAVNPPQAQPSQAPGVSTAPDAHTTHKEKPS